MTTDPRQEIGRLDDQTPILLLPVRLETRFGTGVGATHRDEPQLWVRVYPDDCSIDTFEPVLSENEVSNARRYWTLFWQAGGIEDQQRAAWRDLVASHGSGRAEWIVTTYRPRNVDEQPTKPLATDVVLTVATETPLDPRVTPAAATYWRSVWLADGDKAGVDAARDALVTAVGTDRADDIVTDHQPVNLAVTPAAPLTKAQVNVTTAFVVFPPAAAVATKPASWTRAPTAELLPDCFVFVGYAGDGEPKVILGEPVPSPLVAGPDPSLPPEEQLRQQDGELVVPEPMRWMVDFEVAVKTGMGFRVPLDEPRFEVGFDRIVVLGLRLGVDRDKAKAELENLLTHHRRSRRGFALVPQGTPTNNTEGSSSGSSRGDDADASFDDLRQAPLFSNRVDWLDKQDGQWLAEYLGIDAAALSTVRHSGGHDQADARAMNLALWPATLGYWLDTMLRPVVGPAGIQATRRFFHHFVSGRGAVPAVRIGNQPYGILPATAFSRLRWLLPSTARDDPVAARASDAFLARLYDVLLQVRADWSPLEQRVSTAWGDGDPHQTLLDIVGLHPASVELWQRYAQSVDELYNRLNLEGQGGLLDPVLTRLPTTGMDLLNRLGYHGSTRPELLGKAFLGTAYRLSGPVVDDRPLSETAPVRTYTTDGRNYVRWLADAASRSLQALYEQDGFVDDQPPNALLFLFLRHALQLGYFDTSVRLHVAAGVLDPSRLDLALQEQPFLHVAERPIGHGGQVSESRYRFLYGTEPAITGSPTVAVGDFIGGSLGSLPEASALLDQVRAVERLAEASTGRLERAFVDHIDCCTHRLDAWLLGLVHHQLAAMRNLVDGKHTRPNQGIHLGAYAWLHEVRPERRTLTPVELDPPLDKIFQPQADPPLVHDDANQGFIQAPSLNQAVAAAVLRNGYLSNAGRDNHRTLAVDLTSERVRRALAVLEGIRGGQSLGALLGYQFERGLHDRHGLAEVDKFIYPIRKAFPLAGDRLASTSTDEGVPIEAIEARNVADGLALVELVKAAGADSPDARYPFGKSLPTATSTEAAAVDAEVERLLDTQDAVADLALAEGVYQAVLGNYDRVASTYDAYSKGNFPPEPQVVQTPASGIGLTHRVGLHLDPDADPAVSPIDDVDMTPRAQAEPAVNQWLARMLPPFDQIGCKVSFRDATTSAQAEREVTLHDLALQPADLIALISGDASQAMGELDDRIVRFTVGAESVRPDAPVTIRYMDVDTAAFSVFEAMPLAGSLRTLTQLSRPLRASDLALTNEASADTAVFLDQRRMELVQNAMQTLRGDLAGFQTGLETLLVDLEHRRPDLLAGIDTALDDLASLLARAAGFVVIQAGWGFAYDARRRVFASIMARCAELVDRWDDRATRASELLDTLDDLPPEAPDDERFALLQQAERLVSTATTFPRPAVGAYRAIVEGKREVLGDRRDAFAAVAVTGQTTFAGLRSEVTALLPVTDVDSAGFSIGDDEDAMVRFAEDAVGVAKVVSAELDRRLSAAQTFLDQHDAAAEPAAQVAALLEMARALLGTDAVVVPAFDLVGTQGDEIAQCLAATTSGSLLTYLRDTVKDPFPVDTWLYGVARVRDPLRAWEQLVMLTGAFSVNEPELTPLQLPFMADDHWLALQFPSETRLDTDRLLYTGHFSVPFDKTSRQCGLLLDEWGEVIPGDDTTTGITFHYDRPNNEAPQAMLLATPAAFTGAWRWDDLLDAVNETMDLARLRAVEPTDVDTTVYTRFLPATITAATVNQLTISVNFALNNNLEAFMERS